MSEVVLDVVQVRHPADADAERGGDLLLEAADLAQGLNTVPRASHAPRVRNGHHRFSPEVYLGHAGHGQRIDLAQVAVGQLRQDVPQGLARQAGPVFHACESLLFDARRKSAVDDACRSGIPVINAEPDNANR